MRKVLLILCAVLLANGLFGFATAADMTVDVEADSGGYNWSGSTATGLNQNYDGLIPVDAVLETGRCDKTQIYYCDEVLLKLSNPLTEQEILEGKQTKSKTAVVSIDNFVPTDGPATQFGLFVYQSDPDGAIGPQIARDDTFDPTKSSASVSFSVVTTPTVPANWVLIRVVYYQVINGSYKGHVDF